MASPSLIDVRGTCMNMLNNGSSTENCYSELVDDSLGAEAKTIYFHLDNETKQFIVVDDGCGMDRENLRSAHSLNRRSEISNRHGRFGIGRKQALAQFTRLKGQVNTITRSTPGGQLYQLNIDFPDVLESGIYSPSAHGIEQDYRGVWDTYVIDESGTGTMTIMGCEPEIFSEMLEKASSSRLDKSIRYNLGMTYHEIINEGVQMEVAIDAEPLPVHPIDPLCFDSIPTENKAVITLRIYMNPENKKDVRAYFENPFMVGTRLGYYDCSGKKLKFLKESPPNDFVHLGNIVVSLAYHRDWIELQRESLESIGIEVPRAEQEGRQEFKKMLGGTWIVRSKKVIASLPPTKANKGNKDRYPFVENSRMKIAFFPVMDGPVPDDTFTLDDVFNVEVNKSRVNTSLINPSVWKSCEKLHDLFASERYKNRVPPQVAGVLETPRVDDEAHETDSDESTATDSPTPVAPVATTAAVPIPPPPPNHGITFGNTDGYIVIYEHGLEISRSPYVGAPHVFVQLCKSVLIHKGLERLKEWLPGFNTNNAFLLN